MRKTVAITVLIVAASVLLAVPALAGGKKRKGATRVDFDDALIKGQTNRGAVHLIERKDSNLGSLVKKRTHYRKEILAPYGYDTEVGLERDAEAEAPAGEAPGAKKTKKVSQRAPNKPVASKVVKKKRRKK